MAKTGRIKNVKKDKGYEIIPRSLLQHERLSLQAIGLLCNLQSYPEDWDLYKSELYKRFPKNKETSVRSAFKELIEEKYMIEIKEREGKKWVYSYYFQLEPFSDDEIKEIYGDHNLGTGFSSPENEVPKMRSSKPRSKILNKEDITQEDITQEDITHHNNQNQNHKEDKKEEDSKTTIKFDFDCDENKKVAITNSKYFQFLFERMKDRKFHQDIIFQVGTALYNLGIKEFSASPIIEPLDRVAGELEAGKKVTDIRKYVVAAIYKAVTNTVLPTTTHKENEVREKKKEEQKKHYPFYNFFE